MDNTIGKRPDSKETASRLAILEVLQMHSRGLDRCDAACIKAAYWEDATVDYGSFKGNAHTFAGIVVSALAEQYELTQHFLGLPLFRIHESEARSETYVTAHHLLRGGQEDLFYSGRYLDVLRERDGFWKIASRTVVMDWSRRLEVTDERSTAAFADLTKGTHDAFDPIHAFWAESD